MMLVQTKHLSLHRASQRSVKVHAIPNPILKIKAAKENLKKAIHTAMQTCRNEKDTDSDTECVLAWDTVEELSKAVADRTSVVDPLEYYCNQNPSAFECKLYDL